MRAYHSNLMPEHVRDLTLDDEIAWSVILESIL